MFWGGVTGAIYLPRVSFPPNGPGYLLVPIGAVGGVIAYLTLRFTNVQIHFRAIWLSGFRSAIVVGWIAYTFLVPGNIAFSLGAAVSGFAFGLFFYCIERIMGKLIPSQFGGDSVPLK